jgi:hypothetical protein
MGCSASSFSRFTPGKKPLYTVSRKLSRFQCRSVTFWGRQKSLVPVGNQTMIPRRPHLSLITIQTTLSRLYRKNIRRIYSNQFHIPQCLAARCLQVKYTVKITTANYIRCFPHFKTLFKLKPSKLMESKFYVMCWFLCSIIGASSSERMRN